MQLKNILSELSDLHPDLFQLPFPTSEIFGVRILLEGERPEESDLLYLCPLDRFRLLELDDGRRYHFFLPGAARENMDFPLPSAVNLVLLPGCADLLSVYNRILDFFMLEQRLGLGMRSLTNALFSDRGLQHIVDVAYSILKNPIFVSDAANRYLAAVYDEASVEPGSPFEMFITNDILYNYIDEGGRDFIRELNLDEILSRASTPYCIQHPRFKRDAMFSSIRVHNVVVGKIFIVAMEHPFTSLDYQYFCRLVELVGQELQKNDSVVRNRYENESILLINLLTSSHADPDILVRSLSDFRFAPDSNFYICLFQPRISASSADSLHTLQAQLKSALPAHLTAILDGRLIALLNFPAGHGISDYLRERLEDFVRRNGLLMGVSNSFTHLSRIRHFYSQVVDVLTLGQDFIPGQSVFFYCDTTVLELLTYYQRKRDLSDLIHPHILALLSHDEKLGTEYLRTLDLYLKAMCNSQQAAQNLHIHKNTLLYRLNKLSGHFGLDLTRGDRVLQYQLSLEILRLLHRLDELAGDRQDE